MRLHSHTLRGGDAEGDTWGTLISVEYEKNSLVYVETVPDIEALGGSRHDDILAGDSRNNIIWGDAGNDRLYGGPGGGDDKIYGGSGDDTLYGGLGNDRLHGGPGEDVLLGGRGADTFVFAPGDNEGKNGHTLNYVRDFNPIEGDQIDLIAWTNQSSAADIRQSVETTGLHLDLDQDGSWDVVLEDYLDRILDAHTIFEPQSAVFRGASGDDHLIGSSGNDELYGGDGFDWLYGGEGDDRLYSGVGFDVGIDGVEWGSELHGGPGDDYLEGGAHRDALLGGPGDDELHGGAGYDELYGEKGDDVLNGGVDPDSMNGGPGADTFVFAPGDDGGYSESDIINDFNPAEGDRIDLTAYEETKGIQDINQGAYQSGPTTGWVIDLDQDGYWDLVLVGYFEHVVDAHFIFAP